MKLEITRDHIKRARLNSCGYCAAALALADHFGLSPGTAYVDSSIVLVWPLEEQRPLRFQPSKSLNDFIRLFDTQGKLAVRPGRFILTRVQ